MGLEVGIRGLLSHLEYLRRTKQKEQILEPEGASSRIECLDDGEMVLISAKRILTRPHA